MTLEQAAAILSDDGRETVFEHKTPVERTPTSQAQETPVAPDPAAPAAPAEPRVVPGATSQNPSGLPPHILKALEELGNK